VLLLLLLLLLAAAGCCCCCCCAAAEHWQAGGGRCGCSGWCVVQPRYVFPEREWAQVSIMARNRDQRSGIWMRGW
jgi:hypothetical protein